MAKAKAAKGVKAAQAAEAGKKAKQAQKAAAKKAEVRCAMHAGCRSRTALMAFRRIAHHRHYGMHAVAGLLHPRRLTPRQCSQF